ncbi:MAG: (2Fe-2S)-binding protein [Trueperaceae bacterium]
MAELTINVNGRPQTVDVDPSLPLLYVLRNDLELDSPKFGCGLAQCGACTVVVDGNAVRSCVTSVASVEGSEVITNEGLGTAQDPSPLQEAFIAEQAAQCGYCISGIMMSAHALLAKNPDPSEAEIREALAGNLCRCGTHKRIIAAIKRAAGQEVAAV